MRAHPRELLSHVAVMAQDLEPFRVVLFPQPCVETVPSTKCFAVFAAPSLNMVYGEELSGGFPAATADRSVSINRGITNSVVPSECRDVYGDTVPFTMSASVSTVPLTVFFTQCLPPGSSALIEEGSEPITYSFGPVGKGTVSAQVGTILPVSAWNKCNPANTTLNSIHTTNSMNQLFMEYSTLGEHSHGWD